MKENPSTPRPPAPGNLTPGNLTPRQALGRWGEARAAQYLESLGYQILERNVRTPHGELDLIARLPDAGAHGPAEQADPLPPLELPTIVFVEVKARSTVTFGYPEVSVSARKRLHLLQAAQYYIQQHPDLECNWRIDVIAIQRLGQNQPAQIVHFENALGA